MTKTQNKNIYLWAGLLAAYFLFIAVFSFLYPYAGDEYIGAVNLERLGIFGTYFENYMTLTPKIGVLLANLVLYLGRWSFVVLNPLVQSLSVLCIFYFIFGRLPDFKSRGDIPAFGLILILSVFAVPAPSETLFWVGGAASYSWPVLIFLLFLCALRAQFEGKNFIKNDSPLVLFLVFALAFCLGLSNENNSPMALIIAAGALGVFIFRGKKPPLWLTIAFCGILAGLVLLFGAPGSYKRLNLFVYVWFKDAGLWYKLYLHIAHIHDFIAAQLLLPLLAAAVCIWRLAAAGFKKNIKNKDFILCIFCLGVCAALAGAFFLAPNPGGIRIYYSAGVFGIMAFILALKLLGDNILKYVFAAACAAFIIILPLFTMPYINLHAQHRARLNELKNTTAKNIEIEMRSLYVLTGPTENLTITYYDSSCSAPAFSRIEKVKAAVPADKKNILTCAAPVLLGF